MTKSQWQRRLRKSKDGERYAVYSDWLEDNSADESQLTTVKLVAQFWRWVEASKLRPEKTVAYCDMVDEDDEEDASVYIECLMNADDRADPFFTSFPDDSKETVWAWFSPRCSRPTPPKALLREELFECLPDDDLEGEACESVCLTWTSPGAAWRALFQAYFQFMLSHTLGENLLVEGR